MKPYFEDKGIVSYCADCRDALPLLSEGSIDSIVTDPPYELGFMGKGWDRSGIAYDVEVWRECLRVLKPGGYLLAFGGSRTYHRLACAIEDAGFEIRDQIQWIYGSGFPKSLDVSKAIDAAAGAEREIVGPLPRIDGKKRGHAGLGCNGIYGKGGDPSDFKQSIPTTAAAKQWNGWGTALKPAHEPIVLARKPLIGTVAENVLQHGTGGLNIDGCRIEALDGKSARIGHSAKSSPVNVFGPTRMHAEPDGLGRWPANIILDGSDEVLAGFPNVHGAGSARSGQFGGDYNATSYDLSGSREMGRFGDEGSAARFFYCAKASKKDRGEGNNHPTVKPTQLMRYLCRLVTPPGGVVLDPFGGSGSTAKAALLEGFNCILIEKEAEYCEVSAARIKRAQGVACDIPKRVKQYAPTPLFEAVA